MQNVWCAQPFLGSRNVKLKTARPPLLITNYAVLWSNGYVYGNKMALDMCVWLSWASPDNF